MKVPLIYNHLSFLFMVVASIANYIPLYSIDNIAILVLVEEVWPWNSRIRVIIENERSIMKVTHISSWKFSSSIIFVYETNCVRINVSGSKVVVTFYNLGHDTKLKKYHGSFTHFKLKFLINDYLYIYEIVCDKTSVIRCKMVVASPNGSHNKLCLLILRKLGPFKVFHRKF